MHIRHDVLAVDDEADVTERCRASDTTGAGGEALSFVAALDQQGFHVRRLRIENRGDRGRREWDADRQRHVHFLLERDLHRLR